MWCAVVPPPFTSDHPSRLSLLMHLLTFLLPFIFFVCTFTCTCITGGQEQLARLSSHCPRTTSHLSPITSLLPSSFTSYVPVSQVGKSSVHEVVLVGGSTRIPKIQELLSEFFNGKVRQAYCSAIV